VADNGPAAASWRCPASIEALCSLTSVSFVPLCVLCAPSARRTDG
jgi:hypothetical protein